MEETDPLSEFGEWKDFLAYTNYQISSVGAFMNKRTLKILKHFRHKDSDEICVTLYRFGERDVLSVKLLLRLHIGEEAILPEVVYNNDKITEVALPGSPPEGVQGTKGPKKKPKKPNHMTYFFESNLDTI